jgi:hypothetical protein
VGAGKLVWDMPLLRYFVFVGGALLALLFFCDALLPQVPLPANLASGSDLPAIRIRSDRKWPERVVFDTKIPSIAPVTVAATQAAPVAPAIAAASAKAHVREAFAQLPPGQAESKQAGAKVAANSAKVAATPAGEPNKGELKQPQPKRKVARARPAGRPVMLVAQQPHFGLFDTTW